jgi:hypothetical protein
MNELFQVAREITILNGFEAIFGLRAFKRNSPEAADPFDRTRWYQGTDRHATNAAPLTRDVGKFQEDHIHGPRHECQYRADWPTRFGHRRFPLSAVTSIPSRAHL